MPRWIYLTFQDGARPIILELIYLHDHIIVIMLIVIVLISYIIVYTMTTKISYKFLSEGTLIETIWSIIPAALLIILIIPSLKTLYYIEDGEDPSLRVKVIGHQWYWTYISPLLHNLEVFFKGNSYNFFSFDSMIKPDRVSSLLEATSDIVLPVKVTSRLLITSSDVIHSFAVPRIGLKVDAMPGRINQLTVYPSRCGLFYGQCSEICGTDHAFMPINMKILPPHSYYFYNCRVVSLCLAGSDL